MTLGDDLSRKVNEIISQPWNIRQGNVVPAEDQVSLSGEGVKLDGTVLYADLVESSQIVSEVSQKVAGKVYRSFLYCVGNLISSQGGSVTAYDGDRVMGVFVGDMKNTRAVKCALMINHMVSTLIRPRLTQHFASLGEAGFEISHCVGVDTSPILAVRAGRRGSNDLVWVGRAPNVAAKLSEIRNPKYATFITDSVFSNIHEEARINGEPKRSMWTELVHNYLGENIKVYGSNWTWTV